MSFGIKSVIGSTVFSAGDEGTRSEDGIEALEARVADLESQAIVNLEYSTVTHELTAYHADGTSFVVFTAVPHSSEA